MSEVEKMYKNAGIKPTKNWQSCMYCKEKTKIHYNDWGEEYLTCDRMEMNVEKCPNAKEYYPIFTAEKQLSLIKWLAEFSDFGTFSPDAEIDEDTKVKIYGFALIKREKRYYFIDTRFEIALAKCLNNLWVDMPEEEKETVKEILNG